MFVYSRQVFIAFTSFPNRLTNRKHLTQFWLTGLNASTHTASFSPSLNESFNILIAEPQYITMRYE